MPKKKPYFIFQRTIAIFLVLFLLFSGMPLTVYASETADAQAASASQLSEGGSNTGSTAIVITDYTQNFIAYNYCCYLSDTGVSSNGRGGYSISGNSGDHSVIIGDQAGDNLTVAQQPKAADIPVELNGLTLSGSAIFEIRPIYGGQNKNKVIATAVGASSLNQMKLDENSNMTLAVNADTAVNNLTLAKGSRLSITVAQGVTLTLGTVAGDGALNISGAGTVEVSNSITAGQLELTGVILRGAGGENTAVSVAARDTLTLHSGTVQNLELFGYADSVSGSRTLTLQGGNFNNVAAVGVSEKNTQVLLNIEGLRLVGLTNTNVYRDYSISYEYGGAPAVGEGWLQHYRVKYAGSCDAAHASTIGSRTLPEYAVSGYAYLGWQIAGSTDTTIRELPAASLEGDLTLTAQMQAGEVDVTLDLGFEPSDLTNDPDDDGRLPQKTANQTSFVGTVLDLPAPQRFGYVFRGWKLTTGSARQIPAEDQTTAIAYTDLDVVGDAYKLGLEAQWEPDAFLIVLQPGIGFHSEISNVQVSVDGGTSWHTLAELAAQEPHMSWDAENAAWTSDLRIKYGETLDEFFKRVFGEDTQLPILRDIRGADQGKNRFIGWKTANGAALQADSKFEYGNGGLLNSRKPDETLSEYQNSLHVNSFAAGSEWSAALQSSLTADAAQVTDSSLKSLRASENPAASNVFTYIYKLPMSMQSGVIRYRLLADDGGTYDGFELVTREAMNENRYSSDYSEKIALTMQILNADGNEVGEEVDLRSGEELPLFSETLIGAGCSIRLRMYHSSVMTENVTKTISLKCSFYRNSAEGGQDMQQFFWLKNLQISLTPSMYTVVYDAGLPMDPECNVKDWKDFVSAGGGLGKRTVVTAYGSELLNESPAVEGYTAEQTWIRTKEDGTPYLESDNSIAYGGALTLPVSAVDNGKIYLKGQYQVNTNKYKLTLSTEVLDKWIVKIGENELAKNLTDKTIADVSYDQEITFTGRMETEPAEFIQLAKGDSSSLGELDLYAKPGTANTYTFKMPDYDIEVSYQDVRTLYLEEGSIMLSNNSDGNGYVQADKLFRTWRGSYRIWMDSNNNTDGTSTENRLVIDGDFSGRDIGLGNLNIQTGDSIELKSGAAVTLKSSDIQAKNIAVPSGAVLTMRPLSDTSNIALTPAVGYAAIGGHNGAGGTIALKDLTITNSENTDSMSGTFVLNGVSVSISGCQIGSSENPVSDPIYASSSLIITDSAVYQRIRTPLGSAAPLGTGDAGTAEVSSSAIVSELSGGGFSDKLYSGTLKLMDAASDVVIKGIQLLDVNNGDITIDADKAVQGGAEHQHEGSYLLLSAFDDYSGRSSLTVNGLAPDAKVQTAALTLQNLTANCNTVLQTKGNLTVNGNVAIAEGITLNAAADDDTVSLGGFNGKGSYYQTGGKLTGSSDLVVGGNLTLAYTAAELPGHKLGSNGAAGVTTVSIRNSKINAASVGAMGNQNETFTFVTEGGENEIQGTLIQDHYRLAYDLTDFNFYVTGLPTVLRSETNTPGNADYTPMIPDEPEYTGVVGSSYFKNWYVIRPDGVNVVLSEESVSGFTEKTTLNAALLELGEDTGDGTKTLLLHGWMSLNGKAMIQSGRSFADMGSIADTSPTATTIFSDGQWTARFEIQETVTADSKYQFSFESPIPKGTKLTLCDRSTGTLAWYYYIAPEAVSSVSSDAFVKMESTDAAAVLLSGNEGDALMEKLQLIADFSAAESPAADNTVSMKLVLGEQTQNVGNPLSYDVVPAATASVAATGSDAAGTIMVTVSPGSDNRLTDKKLYAVAVLHNAVTNEAISVPYEADAICGDNIGTWLSGNTAAFNLGDYRVMNGKSFSWSITGLQAGSYQVTWYLSAAENDVQNPFECILAEAAPVSFTQDAAEPPAMTAVLTQVDGMEPSGQVLTAGNAHTVSFIVGTNRAPAEYWVEKQAALKSFAKLNETGGSVGSGSEVTITIPAEAGTYRVCFSIKEECDWDNVYYTFIVR